MLQQLVIALALGKDTAVPEISRSHLLSNFFHCVHIIFFNTDNLFRLKFVGLVTACNLKDIVV